MSTKFAPPERASISEVQRQMKIFRENDMLEKFLGKIPAIFIIVNNYRQVVYMNKGALEFTRLDNVAGVVGKRPGEIFGCIHAFEEEAGCGTSESCTYCGAVNAILSSQRGIPAVEDCRLNIGPNEDACDLRIWAAPLEIDGEGFHVVTIQDIRHEKRRAVLERLFFHDIINTITGIQGAIEILQKYGEKVNQREFLDKLAKWTDNLIDEIQSQSLLSAAESGELQLNMQNINTVNLLTDLVATFKSHANTKITPITLDPSTVEIEFRTDQVLIRRILSNMIKNAVEATPEDGVVTVGCKLEQEFVEFWVHNSTVIPREVQLQIFQRSFSTKGTGRGLGTYGMKILSAFLNGNVSFTSSEKDGTVFRAKYPIKQDI